MPKFRVLQPSFLKEDGEQWEKLHDVGAEIEYSSGHIDTACLLPLDDAAKAFARKNPAPSSEVVLKRLADAAAGAVLKPIPLAA